MGAVRHHQTGVGEELKTGQMDVCFANVKVGVVGRAKGIPSMMMIMNHYDVVHLLMNVGLALGIVQTRVDQVDVEVS